MKNLIKVQATINVIENNTLESKYHSTFNYTDERNLVVKTFCWEQASSYKNIFDRMDKVIVWMESNSTIRFHEMEDDLPTIEEIVEESNRQIKEVGE